MKKSTVFYKIFLPMFLLGAVLVIGFSLFIRIPMSRSNRVI